METTNKATHLADANNSNVESQLNEKKGKGIWVVEGLNYYSNKIKWNLRMSKKEVKDLCDMLNIRIKSMTFYTNAECEKYGIHSNTDFDK